MHWVNLDNWETRCSKWSTLRGIAANRGYNYCFPVHDRVVTDSLGNKLKVDIQNAFTLQNVNPLNIQFIDGDRPVMNEDGFHFNESIFNECPDWVDLRGFFQTEKYFSHVSDMIREMFTFRPEIIDPARQMIESLNKALLHFTFVVVTSFVTLVIITTLIFSGMQMLEQV